MENDLAALKEIEEILWPSNDKNAEWDGADTLDAIADILRRHGYGPKEEG